MITGDNYTTRTIRFKSVTDGTNFVNIADIVSICIHCEIFSNSRLILRVAQTMRRIISSFYMKKLPTVLPQHLFMKAVTDGTEFVNIFRLLVKLLSNSIDKKLVQTNKYITKADKISSRFDAIEILGITCFRDITYIVQCFFPKK